MFRSVLRPLATILLCIAAATAVAQGTPVVAQVEAPAPQLQPPAEERQERQIRIDLADILVQAREAVRAGDFQTAVGLYRFILRFAPDLKVAQLELSFALAALGEQERAAVLLRDLDKEGLSPEVLALIDRIVGPDKLAFFLAPEFFADTNFTGQTKDEIVIINGLPFRLSEEARGQRGFGYGITFGANYRLIDRNPRTTLTTGVTIRDFTGGDDDQQNLFTTLSFRYDLGRFGLVPSVSAAIRYKDWQPREHEAGVGLAIPMDLRPVRNTLGVRYRKIEDETDDDGRLDRKIYDVYDTVSFGYAGIGFRFEERIIREDWLETDAQDNYRIISGLDLTFAEVPWIVPTVGGSYTFRNFKNPAAFFNQERLDRAYEGHIELTSTEWKPYGARPFIRYEYTSQSSNISLFEYDRHEVSVGVRAITW